MTVQPGWYADPAEPTTQRYWDGDGWVGAPLPVDATPPPGPPPAEPEPEPAEPEPAEPEPARPEPAAAPSSGAPVPPGTPGPPAAPAPPWSGVQPGALPPGGPPPWAVPPGAVPPGGLPPGWPGPYPYGYAAPPPRPHGLDLAPFGPRLVARLIDIGLVFLLNVLVNGWFVWRFAEAIEPVYREITRRVLAGESSTEGLPQASAQAEGLQVVILLIAVALWFAYEVPAIANGGQTFGKRVMGIKVVPLADNEQMSFGRSFRRWNVLGLPVFLWSCGIGFVLQLVDCAFPLFDRPLRQALHDKRAQTVVVQLPRPAGPSAGTPAAPTDTPGGAAS